MATVKMSQKEYLRKYLSEDKGSSKKKKKKKNHKFGTKTMKIIDDDAAAARKMRPLEEGEFEILNNTEDAPLIVGVVDERGPVDFADKGRWRIIADDGEGNVTCRRDSADGRGVCRVSKVDDAALLSTTRHAPEGDSSPPLLPRRSSKHQKWTSCEGDRNMDLRPPHKTKKRPSSRGSSESDQSPPRRRKKEKDSDMDSARRRKKEEEEDIYPPRRRKQEEEEDVDPPRRRKKEEEEDIDPPRRRKKEDSDIDPPRRRKKEEDSDIDPPRRRKKEEDSDIDPPRRRRKKNEDDSDIEPPRRRKKNEDDSDIEPPRRRKKEDDSDIDPPRRRKKEDDSDVDPPRRRRKKDEEDSDIDPPRRRRIKDSEDSDIDPPRRRRREEDSDIDPSRRRKKEEDSDIDPPRRRIKEEDSDIDPPRRRRKKDSEDSDIDPPRRDNPGGSSSRGRAANRYHRDRSDETSRREDKSPPRWNENRGTPRGSPESRVNRDSRMKKTLDGKTAGLQDARALRIETEEHKKREADLLKRMSAEVSGLGQAAVLRDRRTGRKRDLAAEAAERREKEQRQAEINDKYAKWGRGLKQVDDQAEKRQRDLYEMSKPLARYANDADLDRELREAEREGDTMLEEIKKRQIKEGKRKADVPSARHQAFLVPNRFGIKPGHRWDGIDRSNGYEKKWFEARNARTALAEEAYKWSTADM